MYKADEYEFAEEDFAKSAKDAGRALKAALKSKDSLLKALKVCCYMHILPTSKPENHLPSDCVVKNWIILLINLERRRPSFSKA